MNDRAEIDLASTSVFRHSSKHDILSWPAIALFLLSDEKSKTSVFHEASFCDVKKNSGARSCTKDLYETLINRDRCKVNYGGRASRCMQPVVL